MNTASLGPQRIVCLTEETTEWLYLLGQEHRIVGISGYTVRPRIARQEKPRVSAFLDGKIEGLKIGDLREQGFAAFGQAGLAVEEARDERMFETGEDAPFQLEPRLDEFAGARRHLLR